MTHIRFDQALAIRILGDDRVKVSTPHEYARRPIEDVLMLAPREHGLREVNIEFPLADQLKAEFRHKDYRTAMMKLIKAARFVDNDMIEELAFLMARELPLERIERLATLLMEFYLREEKLYAVDIVRRGE